MIKKYKIFLFLAMATILGIFCIYVAIKALRPGIAQNDEVSEAYDNVKYYTIMDNMIGDMAYMHTDPELIPHFKSFYELLKSSEYFDYLPMYSNPVYIDNYSGPESNVNYYEHGESLESETYEFIDDDGTTTPSTCVKAFWLGEDSVSYFGLAVEEGRLFEEDDYIFNPKEYVSVLLGHNYTGAYEVGDVIDIKFVFSERPAVVVGILEEGISVFDKRSFCCLDNYLIMPLFENDDYDGEQIYNIPINFMYLFRTEGTIVTKMTNEDISEIIEIYLNESGFGDLSERAYYVEG